MAKVVDTATKEAETVAEAAIVETDTVSEAAPQLNLSGVAPGTTVELADGTVVTHY